MMKKFLTWHRRKTKFKVHQSLKKRKEEVEEEIMLKRQSITDVERSINTDCTVITQSTVNGSNFLFVEVRLYVFICGRASLS